jgi:hypothetical protein
MSEEEFWERLVARTLRNASTTAHSKMAKDGTSFAGWRAQIKNLDAWLTWVAKHAAIDEARQVLHGRATKKLPTNEELLANLPPPSLNGSHDPTTLVLALLSAKLPLRQDRDIVEHIRCCGPCFERLKIVKFMLRDFTHSGRMNPELALLVKVIGIEKEATKIALTSRNLADREIRYLENPANHTDSEEERRDRGRFFLRLRTNLDLSLDALGCSQSQRKRRNSFDYWLTYQNWFIEMENRITAILYLAKGMHRYVRGWATIRRVHWFFSKSLAKKGFDQLLTNDPKSRSTRPTKSTFSKTLRAHRR